MSIAKQILKFALPNVHVGFVVIVFDGSDVGFREGDVEGVAVVGRRDGGFEGFAVGFPVLLVGTVGFDV